MYARLIAPVVGLALVVGCSTPGYKKAETTNASLGDVKSELITDKTTLTAAVNDLNDLVYNPKSNLKPQYEKFAAEVTALQRAQASSRKSARNLVADHYKSSRYKLEQSTSDMVGAGADSAEDGPEGEVLAGITNAALLSAVRKLGQEQQDCIVLRFLQGLSVAETVAILGKDEGAVKALQYRAVKALGRLLPSDLVA